MTKYKLINPFISFVASIVSPTPIINNYKARAMLINPPIEPMRKHKYKPIEAYIRRATFINTTILYQLAFSVFNLPCCYIETPFGSNFITNLISQKIQTKPYKEL